MKRLCLAILLALAICASSAFAQLVGPTPYLSDADSPFAGLGLSSFYLEDFEDSALKVPGVVASVGVPRAPGPETDSVDGDDGRRRFRCV